MLRQRSLLASNAERLKINPGRAIGLMGARTTCRGHYAPRAPQLPCQDLQPGHPLPPSAAAPYVPAPQQPLPRGTYVYKPSQKRWPMIGIESERVPRCIDVFKSQSILFRLQAGKKVSAHATLFVPFSIEYCGNLFLTPCCLSGRSLTTRASFYLHAKSEARPIVSKSNVNVCRNGVASWRRREIKDPRIVRQSRPLSPVLNV